MFQQYYNGDLVWVLSQGEFWGVILAAIIVALAFLLFVALTAPVSIGYLKARLSKNKYLLLVLDKTHCIRFLQGKMQSSVVEARGVDYASFVKNDDSGSYNLGAVKMDVVSSGNALVHHDQYIAAIEVMKKLGIDSEEDAAALATAYMMKKKGIELPPGARLPELSMIQNDADIEILIPTFNKVSLSDLGRWLSITPETIKGYVEAEKDQVKKKLTRKDGTSKSGGLPGGLLLALGIGVVVIIVVMALMKNGTI